MLTCYMCGETKPAADFAFADMAKGTRQRHCRKCQAAYRRAHYLANRDDYIRREVARINGYRIDNRALLVAYLLAHPCVDCGETDPVKLEFDHRDPSLKRGNIGFIAARKPWHLVLREIEKCDVRCANCHARRTAKQQNWRKFRNTPIAEGPWLLRKLPSAQTPPPIDAPEATRGCTGCGLERPITEFPSNTRSAARERLDVALVARPTARLTTNGIEPSTSPKPKRDDTADVTRTGRG